MFLVGLVVSRIWVEEFVVLFRCFYNVLDFNLDEFIMIFLSVLGNLILLCVFELDSIEFVKLRI